ncbi:MAG: hypothetical protein HWE09_00765 [Cyclobacteriaceae bacterium]|nr:hypothetical protein [Cyclobacteriaceae bacterium]
MISFFRKIRQKLLQDLPAGKAGNRITRYLAYALGEIILVVLGILIALQINTWNEFRKSKTLENDYYCKLMEDVSLDILQIQNLIEQTQIRLQASNDLLSLLQKDSLDRPLIMEKNLESISLITYTYRPSMAAYEDLKSSGNLNILRDNDIKTMIVDYYSMIDGMLDVINTNADGAVQLFYKKDNYAAIQWQDMDFVKNNLDTSKVDLKKLESFHLTNREFVEKLTSDAVYYVGANSRILFLYESILPDIIQAKNELEKKCNSKSP